MCRQGKVPMSNLNWLITVEVEDESKTVVKNEYDKVSSQTLYPTIH